MEKKRLGRGLDALFGAQDGAAAAAVEQARVPVEQVDPNPYQPRKVFDGEELAALSASIRSHGILQPLVVRAVAGRYQLVAGERRLRAAQAAGVQEVPVRIVDFNDQQVVEAALIENIQRSDLNDIEKAHGFRDYVKQFGVTHEELATRVGLNRPTVSNLIRLLDAPAEVQEWVRTGQLSGAHARALLSLGDHAEQLTVGKEVIARGLSVKATEVYVRERKGERAAPASRAPAVEKTTHVQSIEDDLRQRLTTKVEIRLKAKEKGQIVLTFESNDDFERLLEVLRR